MFAKCQTASLAITLINKPDKQGGPLPWPNRSAQSDKTVLMLARHRVRLNFPLNRANGVFFIRDCYSGVYVR